MAFRLAIFDLDGVCVNTVPLHFKAWKRMFAEYGRPFTREDYEEKVDGIPRLDGARAILSDLSEEELEKAASHKQEYYLEYLNEGAISIYESTVNLMKELKAKGIKLAVISSSRNCPYILKKTGLEKLLDVQVSGQDITRGKPDPEIFLRVMEKLNMGPEECLVFEDAFLGVEAAKRAGMLCVGIDRHHNPARLQKADLVVEDLSQVDGQKIEELFQKKGN